MKKKQVKYLSFNIQFPAELIPLYDFLQDELNFFLSDDDSRLKLSKIDLNLHKGDVWRAMRDLFKERISTWPIRNKTWYSYILYENIRRELQSKRNNVLIWHNLVNNSKNIDSKLMNDLHKLSLYPTKMFLKNLLRADNEPSFAKTAVFQLDYTVSSSQMFKKDQYNFCKIQNMDGTWLDYQIILPMSLNQNTTGVIAKPRFMRRASDNSYIGLCSYEYLVEDNDGDSILGVDFGKIKYFSAVALDKTRNYSDEFIQSKRVSKLLSKINKLYNEKNKLKEKIAIVDNYAISTDRQNRRKLNLTSITNKIIKSKKTITKIVSAELSTLAKKLNCKEIHVENLSWLESVGGKWNFSEIQTQLESKCKQKGIKLIKVSAWNSSKMHPVTGEIGKINNRLIQFENSYSIDRDVLAGINLALRTKGSIKKRIHEVKKKHRKSISVKTPSRRKAIKEQIKEIKRNMQIVVFQPCQASSTTTPATWCPIYSDIPNSSLLVKQKLQ